MAEFSRSVVAGVILCSADQILLMNRNREPYRDYWSILGGKAKRNERPTETAHREVREETGLDPTLDEHVGVVSELLVRADDSVQHSILNVFEASTRDTVARSSSEGRVEWFSRDNIDRLTDSMVPTDSLIFDTIVEDRSRNYVDCTIYEDDESYDIAEYTVL